MTTITDQIKKGVDFTVRLLNQPAVKEGVKNIAGTVTFAFGIVEIYDLCQIAKGRAIAETTENSWSNTANKIVIVCAKLSLILSAGVSRPGVYIISSLTGALFTPTQIESAFGPNTTFALNPWHPRHVISIAAAILALPVCIQAAVGICKKVFCCPQQKQKEQSTWLSDAKVRLMSLFNLATGRPTLHLGNQLGRYILR